MDYYNYDAGRFNCTAETAFETLEKWGVAVIPSVLSEKECEKGLEDMWTWLSSLTASWEDPIEPGNKASWRGFRELFPKHSMLLQQWGIGHAQYVWDVRQNPKVVEAFAALHKVKPTELLTSFDGSSIHLPPEVTGLGWFRKAWMHCDQSFTRNGFECAQGQINLTETRAGDASLAVLEGSNKLHAAFAKEFNITDKSDWFKLDSEAGHHDWYAKQGCVERRITSPAGSLVLWDSRTIHCGTEPVKVRAKPNIRCCVYTCYQPKSLCSKRDLAKRVKAFEDLRTTSHWAARPKLFPTKPRTYGAALPEISEKVMKTTPVLSKLGLSLVGY